MGNTLRGPLLYGYAFATIGTIAGIAAIVSFVGCWCSSRSASGTLAEKRYTPRDSYRSGVPASLSSYSDSPGAHGLGRVALQG